MSRDFSKEKLGVINMNQLLMNDDKSESSFIILVRILVYDSVEKKFYSPPEF